MRFCFCARRQRTVEFCEAAPPRKKLRSIGNLWVCSTERQCVDIDVLLSLDSGRREIIIKGSTIEICWNVMEDLTLIFHRLRLMLSTQWH